MEDLLDLRIPLGELPEDARAWQVGVDQLASEDSEVAEYVQTLEEARDTSELPEASGEAIAREFERYLRRRDGGLGPGDQQPSGHATEGGDGSYRRGTSGGPNGPGGRALPPGPPRPDSESGTGGATAEEAGPEDSCEE